VFTLLGGAGSTSINELIHALRRCALIGGLQACGDLEIPTIAQVLGDASAAKAETASVRHIPQPT
jgi:hypothetical protein